MCVLGLPYLFSAYNATQWIFMQFVVKEFY
jgi:hypothetical protein